MLFFVSKNSVVVNGIDSIIFNVKIFDVNGNLIKNEEIEWDVVSYKVMFSFVIGKI